MCHARLRWWVSRPIALLVATAAISALPSPLAAQSLTTSAVRGTVSTPDGRAVEDARVSVANEMTGVVQEGRVRQGRFLIQGLEAGGPYSVTIERLGFAPARREGLILPLGSALDVEVVLEPAALGQDTLRVSVTRPLLPGNLSAGTGTTIPDMLLRRLPTLDRDLYDFVRLVPQVSTRTGLALGGLSAGGAGVRMNEFLIDGASERSVSGGLPASRGGSKSVPLEAVREYQVLLTPYDVRYGDFTGALVNTVTRSGTNELSGSAFAYWRNDGLGGADSIPPYDRWQYGFTLGGPIIRDRLHFFVAPELQALASPAPGPYLGQSADAVPPVPVTEAAVDRFAEILRGYGLEPGSGDAVENSNPLRNVFGRIDLSLPEWNSRAVLSESYARNRTRAFQRDSETFPLSAYRATQISRTWTGSLQLHTSLGTAGTGHNELLLSHWVGRLDALPDVRQPVVRVAVPGTTGSPVTLVSGTPETAQGGYFDSWSVSLTDNLSVAVGRSHVVTFGIDAERFRIARANALGAYGTWTFSSLDSLAAGVAERYELRRDFGDGSTPVTGGQYALYAGDRWEIESNLRLTAGIRADLLDVPGRAPYNPVVDSIFGRRTDDRLPGRAVLSPRLGFEWEPPWTRADDRIRGGIGIFSGRPPVAWLHSALTSHGVGVGVLRCGPLPSDSGTPVPFVPDYRDAPTSCTEGADLSASPRGEVDLIDLESGMVRTLRASIAYDRALPWGMVATGEALVTRGLSDVVFANLNLAGPQAVDRFGRVLYGTLAGPNGTLSPTLRSDFAEVIDLRETSRNHAYQLTARLQKGFAGGGVAASYTYSRVRDVQTPVRVNGPGEMNWASRAVSGLHEDWRAGISGNAIPHRVVFAGTAPLPWTRGSTVVSFTWVGESGSPFTYRAGGLGRRGDLNADGSNLNDPIYVPTDAFDPDEILFSGVSDAAGADNSPSAQAERVFRQQRAFEDFVDEVPCLRRQRGRIVERNSCREPWTHTTMLSVRQAIPMGRRSLEAEIQLFNLLNLMDGDLGLLRVAQPALLEQVGQTLGPPDQSQPIFRFDAARPEWTILRTESAFQFQFSIRYRF